MKPGAALAQELDDNEVASALSLQGRVSQEVAWQLIRSCYCHGYYDGLTEPEPTPIAEAEAYRQRELLRLPIMV